MPAIVSESFASGPGFDIHYKVFEPDHSSDRVPLLCLPGYWRNSRDFDALAWRLVPERRVITPDMRGRGLSARAADAKDYHFDRLMEDVWALLDRLSIKTVAVLGATLGGLMALEMAATHRDRVAGVILNDVGPEAAATAIKRTSTADELGFAEAVAQVRQQNLAHFPDFGEEDWVRMLHQAYRQVAPGRYARDFDQLTGEETRRFKADRPTFWREFEAAATGPVTVLRGGLSDYLSDDVMRRMEAVSPNVVVETIPNRGHPPQLDEPQSIAAIDRLLLRADAGSSRG